MDNSWATWQNSSRIGENSACIEPARNPLTRLGDNTACIEAAHNPLGRQRDDRPAGRDSASWSKVLWSLING